MKKIKLKITTLVMTLVMLLALCGSYSVSANEKEFPDFKYPTYHYQTVEELGLAIDEMKAFFPESLEVKYENGKYMIEDFGATSASIYHNRDYNRVEMTYENGYWTSEVSEEIYNDENVSIYVSFNGDTDEWKITYIDGIRDSYLQISNSGNMNVILISFVQDYVDICYPLFDRWYRNYYIDGVISEQEVTVYIDFEGYSFCFIEMLYNADGSIKKITVYLDNYYYYSETLGWSTSSSFAEEFLVEVPEPLKDADVDYFKNLCVFTLDCTHEDMIPASCLNPTFCGKCGLIGEGSFPLGHDIVEDLAVDPTCEDTGLTAGSHCSRCDDVTIGQEEVPALGHDIVEDLAVDPTCEDTGLTAGSHCSRCDDATIAQEEVPALGHDVAKKEAVESTCTKSGLTEGSYCKRCDEVFVEQEEVAKLEHDYSETKYDESDHWKECSCGEKKEVEGHKSGEATETEKAICEVCGASYGELKEEKGCNGSIAASVFGLVSLLGTVIILRKKREE